LRLYTSVHLFDNAHTIQNCTVDASVFNSSAWTNALRGFPGTTIEDTNGTAIITIPSAVLITMMGEIQMTAAGRAVVSFVGSLYFNPELNTISASQAAVTIALDGPASLSIGMNTEVGGCIPTPQGRCLLCSNRPPPGGFIVYTPEGEATSLCSIGCSQGYYAVPPRGCALCPTSPPVCASGAYASECTPINEPKCETCSPGLCIPGKEEVLCEGGSTNNTCKSCPPIIKDSVYTVVCEWECAVAYTLQNGGTKCAFDLPPGGVELFLLLGLTGAWEDLTPLGDELAKKLALPVKIRSKVLSTQVGFEGSGWLPPENVDLVDNVGRRLLYEGERRDRATEVWTMADVVVTVIGDGITFDPKERIVELIVTKQMDNTIAQGIDVWLLKEPFYDTPREPLEIPPPMTTPRPPEWEGCAGWVSFALTPAAWGILVWAIVRE